MNADEVMAVVTTQLSPLLGQVDALKAEVESLRLSLRLEKEIETNTGPYRGFFLRFDYQHSPGDPVLPGIPWFVSNKTCLMHLILTEPKTIADRTREQAKILLGAEASMYNVDAWNPWTSYAVTCIANVMDAGETSVDALRSLMQMCEDRMV